MGDPRKQRSKFSTPSHPWQRVRLDEERLLVDSYGLKNKTELWKHASFLRQMKKQTKSLISRTDNQAKKEKELLLQRAYKLGLLQEGAKPDDILELTTQHILNRRLQSIVFAKKMANTQTQARQFITHEHVVIGKKKINAPSYMVRRQEEPLIAFDESSSFMKEDHPERVKAKEEKKVIKAAPVRDERRERRAPRREGVERGIDVT